MSLKIGISCGILPPDQNRNLFRTKYLSYVEHEMVDYMMDNDCLPLIIPGLHDEKKLNLFVKNIDGLVLFGGSDVAPSSYGEEGIEDNKWPGDLYRDQYELKLIQIANKLQKPILGICRGMQLLNIFKGGTLYQDLETQLPDSNVHRDADQYDSLSHHIKIQSSGVLFHIYKNQLSKKNEILVNSVHHQGVKKLGHELELEATSIPDQIIEAFSGPSHLPIEQRNLLGVQWHPEFSALKGKVVSPHPIMQHFLSLCKNPK